ncbi:transporter substrate-binding domain-containing protein [Haliea sp. E17]|uniref:transporter substrate-binding domain-containing protein n=1 Tax=Haliea sp. E17 TaxID=3401576 RepID=UPI003AAB1528
MGKIISALVLILCFPLLASAAGELRVGMTTDYPPLAFRQSGEVFGVEADNARAVGKILSRQVRIVELPFAELIPALQAGRIDVIMSGLSATAERSREVQFTEPYLRVGQMAIIHRDKVGSFSQPWAIYREGVRIGVEPDTTGAAFAARELPDAEIKFFADSAAAFQALRNNLIDIYIHDAPTSWQLANSKQDQDLISMYRPLTEEMLAWAVRKDDQALAGELNRSLQLMRSNGTLDYILNRWIPVTIEVQ